MGHIGPHVTIRCLLCPYGPILAHMMADGARRSHLGQYGHIRAHTWPYWHECGPMMPDGARLIQMGHYGALWAHILSHGSYKEIWKYMCIYKHIHKCAHIYTYTHTYTHEYTHIELGALMGYMAPHGSIWRYGARGWGHLGPYGGTPSQCYIGHM